jgi:hypothetical protein
MVGRIKSLVAHSDPEMVMVMPAAALILFGVTLLWPGQTFAGPAFVVLSSLIVEEFAGVLAVLVGALALISLLRGNGFMRAMCLLLVAVHVFLGTMFVLSGINSTGNTYYVYAAGAAWVSWRLIGR